MGTGLAIYTERLNSLYVFLPHSRIYAVRD